MDWLADTTITWHTHPIVAPVIAATLIGVGVWVRSLAQKGLARIGQMHADIVGRLDSGDGRMARIEGRLNHQGEAIVAMFERATAHMDHEERLEAKITDLTDAISHGDPVGRAEGIEQ